MWSLNGSWQSCSPGFESSLQEHWTCWEKPVGFGIIIQVSLWGTAESKIKYTKNMKKIKLILQLNESDQMQRLDNFLTPVTKLGTFFIAFRLTFHLLWFFHWIPSSSCVAHLSPLWWPDESRCVISIGRLLGHTAATSYRHKYRPIGLCRLHHISH